METYYRQESPERCVKAMKKSGKLAVALIGIALGVLLLVFGNRAGNTSESPDPSALPEGAVSRSVEEYRADLEARMEGICGQVAGVGTVDVIVTLVSFISYHLNIWLTQDITIIHCCYNLLRISKKISNRDHIAAKIFRGFHHTHKCLYALRPKLSVSLGAQSISNSLLIVNIAIFHF